MRPSNRNLSVLLAVGISLALPLDPALAKPKHHGQEPDKAAASQPTPAARPYEYDYYPALKVYHNRTTDTFFWIENGQWCQSPRPPSHISLGGDRKRIRMGGETPYEYHQVNFERLPYGQAKKKFGKRRGPPDHAPAWGYRRKQEYVYFPHQQVYYHPCEKQYLWVEKGQIKVGVELPPWIKVDPANGVTMDIDRALNLDDFKKVFK